jgi:hypothetical protein
MFTSDNIDKVVSFVGRKEGGLQNPPQNLQQVLLKPAVLFSVRIGLVTRFHKTCSKFCGTIFSRKDWNLQNLLQVLFLCASFVFRKDRP